MWYKSYTIHLIYDSNQNDAVHVVDWEIPTNWREECEWKGSDGWDTTGDWILDIWVAIIVRLYLVQVQRRHKKEEKKIKKKKKSSVSSAIPRLPGYPPFSHYSARELEIKIGSGKARQK